MEPVIELVFERSHMHDQAKPDPLMSVNPSQERAIEVLLSGGTQQEAAAAAGVSRETVNRWRNRHPGFIAELNQQRHNRALEFQDRLRDMDGKALTIVADALGSGDRAAALMWIKARTLSAISTEPSGPRTADEVLDVEAANRANQELADAEYRNNMMLRSAGVGTHVASPDASRAALANELRGEFALPDPSESRP